MSGNPVIFNIYQPLVNQGDPLVIVSNFGEAFGAALSAGISASLGSETTSIGVDNIGIGITIQDVVISETEKIWELVVSVQFSDGVKTLTARFENKEQTINFQLVKDATNYRLNVQMDSTWYTAESFTDSRLPLPSSPE
jgi:hypothetical protein